MSYKRVLLKLSGEALMGQGSHGIDPEVPFDALTAAQRGLVLEGEAQDLVHRFNQMELEHISNLHLDIKAQEMGFSPGMDLYLQM